MIATSSRTMGLSLALLALALPARAEDWKIDPTLAIVGGVAYETIQPRAGDDREDRFYTVALSRIGLTADLTWGLTIESEFEVNAGPHGTSVWEGQAALQVRNQAISLNKWGLRIQAGRLTDESSFDFSSAHVMDQLMTDYYTRTVLLASGFNRGNGILASYEVVKGLRLGLTVNAGNPVSTTGALVVGGTFAPFSRVYIAPWQQVGRDASKFPADEFDFLLITPFITYRSEFADAQASLQLFRVNTNTASEEDEPIDGYNVRLGARGKLLNEALRFWANWSLVQNEVVDPNDGARLSGDIFTGMTFSAGVDYDFLGKTGVGVQYALVRDQQGLGTRTTQHYFNLGASWWVHDTTALGARFGLFMKCEEPNTGGGCPEKEGTRSYFLTLRTFL